MVLPNDENMLLSLVNTKLRDGYSPEDFCAEYCIEKSELVLRLKRAGYEYDEGANAFKAV